MCTCGVICRPQLHNRCHSSRSRCYKVAGAGGAAGAGAGSGPETGQSSAAPPLDSPKSERSGAESRSETDRGPWRGGRRRRSLSLRNGWRPPKACWLGGGFADFVPVVAAGSTPPLCRPVARRFGPQDRKGGGADGPAGWTARSVFEQLSRQFCRPGLLLGWRRGGPPIGRGVVIEPLPAEHLGYESSHGESFGVGRGVQTVRKASVGERRAARMDG
jgi:hypothetical protein